MKIAITGGFGSGKTTVSRLVATVLHADLVDTDHLCRVQMQPENDGYNSFKKMYCDRFDDEDGLLDRDKLRKVVYGDPEVKRNLEQILHPLVREKVEEMYQERVSLSEILVVEVPLLFEVGWQADFNKTVVVYSDQEVCLDRVFQRDNLDSEQIQAVIKSQISLTQKVEMSDFVINNSSTFCATFSQITWLCDQLTPMNGK